MHQTNQVVCAPLQKGQARTLHLLCQSDNTHWVMQIVLEAFLLAGRCGSLLVHAQYLISSPHYSLVVTGVPPGTAGEVATGTSLPQPIWSPEPQRWGQRQEVPRLPQRFHWANCLKYSNCTRRVRTYIDVAMAPHPPSSPSFPMLAVGKTTGS